MSATDWRAGGHRRWPEWQKNRNPSKAAQRGLKQNAKRKASRRHFDVQVKQLPSYRVAYLRYVGPYGAYGIPKTWARIGTIVSTFRVASFVASCAYPFDALKHSSPW